MNINNNATLWTDECRFGKVTVGKKKNKTCKSVAENEVHIAIYKNQTKVEHIPRGMQGIEKCK